jgi:hypothetical protein
MNVYDPSDYIVYVVLGADSAPPASARPENRLPSGYANQSPRTSLRHRGAPVRELRRRTAVS